MDIQKKDQGREDLKSTDQQEKKIKYDKGEVTYGHVISDPLCSRKDKSVENEQAEDVYEKLNHLNLTQDSDLGKRNENKEKLIQRGNL